MTMTATRCSPILFTGAMVRALLDRSKTQTRRVVVEQPSIALNGKYEPHDPFVHDDGVTWSWMSGAVTYTDNDRRCPYGKPGDQLWVRETWAAWCVVGAGDLWRFKYAADGKEETMRVPSDWEPPMCLWNSDTANAPSIFMPKWACRLTLEITDVRVQRLQEITEADAVAEGAIAGESAPTNELSGTARGDYARIWNEINARRGYGWSVNPWVWALTFAVVRP